jgi:hypothetical protein
LLSWLVLWCYQSKTRSEPNSIGLWSKRAMPDGPEMASKNDDVEIMERSRDEIRPV